MELRGREVLVLGIGESGTAAARLLVREGAQVRCSDGGAGPEVRRRAAALEKIGCRVEFGGHTADFSRGVSLAVLSPGIDPSVPAVRRLRDAGTELISEIELAFALCRRPVTAVTGTNGKTTVVTLIERILREDGRRADACGNIGRAFSDCVRNDVEEGIFVVEASSFQLEASRRFRPRVAVALNLSDDHLDRYRTIEEYGAAKAAIFRNQGEGDSALVKAEERPAWERRGLRRGQRILEFSAARRVAEGACLDGDALTLVSGGKRETVCRRDELPLAGGHDLENALAAAAAAAASGARPASIRRVLGEFKGLPHRMEPVGSRNGVLFVNDSKATNPDAVRRALESAKKPVVLIAGGRDKGFDYAQLRAAVRHAAKGVVLFGEARDTMARALSGAAPIRLAGTLEEAVRAAADQAEPGETVLLSPACASYDMFKNYEERGDAFKRIVGQLRP